MAVTMGNATWPGASCIFGGEYTCQRGTAPDVATIVVPFGDVPNLLRTGNLVITDQNTTRILYDCIIDKEDVADADGGWGVAVKIFDRRHKWNKGGFSGRFNLRDSRGVIIDRPYSPYEICEMILTYMGETNYLIDMPAGVSLSETPLLEFDTMRPDQALNELCEMFARVVVFQPWTNRVVIGRFGVGAELPNLDQASFQAGFDPAERPSKIEAVGAPICYQCVFRLLVAAEEPDGSIVPLDDSSLKPPGGWGKSKFRAFRDVTLPAFREPTSGVSFGVITRNDAAALASKSVWKYFRFSAKEPVNGIDFIEIPGLKFDAPDVQVTTPYQLDFLDGIVYSSTTDPKAKPYMLPPQVYGTAYAGAKPFFNPYRFEDLTIPAESFQGVGFQVDNERKILIADRHIFIAQTNAAGEPECVPPILYCLISVNVRDKYGKLVRYTKDRVIDPAANTLPLVSKHDDCRRVRMVEYNHSTWAVDNVTGNSAAVDPALDFYLDQVERTLEDKASNTREYGGFQPVEPDGAIAQVSWRWGYADFTTTKASRNTEHKYWAPGYEFTLFQMRVKAFFDRRIDFEKLRPDQNGMTSGGGVWSKLKGGP